MANFPEKHPYLTFILGLFAISGVVSIAYAASPVATRLAGNILPQKRTVQGKQLPAKRVG